MYQSFIHVGTSLVPKLSLRVNEKLKGKGRAYAQLSPLYPSLYPSLYPYITHVINYSRPSPVFLYYKNKAMLEPQLVNYSGLIDYQPYFCILSLTKLCTQSMDKDWQGERL